MEGQKMSGRSRLVGVCAALSVAFVAGPGVAAAQLDPSFGSGGVSLLKLSRFHNSALATQVARDGTVLVAGRVEQRRNTGVRDDFAVVRLREDGTLDPAFGVGGVATADIAGSYDYASDVVELPDGRIVLAGYAFVRGSGQSFAFVRLHADGRLDESFGTAGRVIVPARAFGRLGECPYITQLALMADGRIVAGGGTGCADEHGAAFKLIAIRLTADGSLDGSFHGNGLWSSRAGCVAYAVSVLSDGGLLIAGATGTASLCTSGQMRLIRLTADGAYAPGWGSGGRLILRFPGFRYSYARAMAVDDQGRALVVGEVDDRSPFEWYNGEGDPPRLAVARVLADGSLDQSFGQGGRMTARFHPRRESRGHAVALAADGSAVIAVAIDHASPRRYLSRFVLARVTADGRLDAGFGAGGWLRVPFGSRNAFANDVALDQSGRVVAVGSVESRPERGDFTAVRLRPGGSGG
jgi:uncharacterized delta-60 repeat protein